jgi:hypothetical protein
MSGKAATTSNKIIIQNSQGAEMNSGSVIIASETETVIRIKPSMIGMTSCICFMQNGFHENSFNFCYMRLCFLFLYVQIARETH